MHTPHCALLCALLALAPAARAQLERLPSDPNDLPESAGVLGNPDAYRALGRADRQWIQIQRYMRLETTQMISAFDISPFDGAPGDALAAADLAGIKAFLDIGIAFCRENPQDPRRWDWLRFVKEHPPIPLSPLARDLGERADAIKAIEAACVDDSTAPSDLRLEIAGEKLFNDVRVAGLSRKADYDWDAAAAELARLGDRFPGSQSDDFLNTGSGLIHATARHDRDGGAAVLALLKGSRNKSLAALAAGIDAIARARTTPLQMKFTALDGRQVDLAALHGKVVLIDFRGVTWCGACRTQEPLIKDVYGRYHDKGFEIITITWEMRPSARDFVEKYARENGMPWPFYFDGRADNPYIKEFGFRGVPQYFLIGTDGLLLAHTESSGGVRNLEEAVRKALRLPPLQPGDEKKLLGVMARTDPVRVR
jgi:thiol-disulfide isomerase/thioredoxin